MGRPTTTGFDLNYNNRVPDMQFHSDVEYDAENMVNLGKPVAVDADGILVDEVVTTAGSTTTFATTYNEDKMATYGRNVTVVGSAVSVDPVVTVHGFDYLGQPMSEEITANATTSVAGKKAFKKITKIEWTASTAAGNIDVGWGDVLGLPFKATGVVDEYENGAKVATAGTFVAAVTATQTATTGDPRGTYDPNSATDGSKEFKLTVLLDHSNLHGNAHFSS